MPYYIVVYLLRNPNFVTLAVLLHYNKVVRFLRSAVTYILVH